jgi:predicted TIM-barrel fold metal-dependent hydrolase
MWAAIQDVDLPITFHVSTGRDPRAARKEGGAVINYVSHSLSPTIEPVASLCGSGVLERFPKVKFAAVESGIGWVPWALDAMDEAYRKHHLWAYPRLRKLPSEYFRSNGAATFQEDRAGLALAETFNLVDNFMWANDYPHAEGTWPHSAEAIEREMGALSETSRAKILGLNAARCSSSTPTCCSNVAPTEPARILCRASSKSRKRGIRIARPYFTRSSTRTGILRLVFF